jgi:hypothetical protein
MAGENDRHAACVAAWLERAGDGLGAEGLLELLERACEALWTRLRPTLGDVTLGAIADRVVHDAAERFAPFASIEVAATGLRFEALRARAGGLRAGELEAAIRDVLTDFLRVLGHLTAEVVTPAMHATLSAVAPASGAPSGVTRRAGRGPGRKKERETP